MENESPPQIWRVSPLLKMRLMFGMPWVFAIAVLFIASLGAGIVKFFLYNGRTSVGLVIFAIVIWVLGLAAMGFGAFLARRDIGILQHAGVATGTIEGIEVKEFAGSIETAHSPSEFHTFHLMLEDDHGNVWHAKYNAGILGYDAQEGERLEVLFDTRDPDRVTPLRYMHGLPIPGEDGVIRTAKAGEAWGFLGVGLGVLALWLGILIW